MVFPAWWFWIETISSLVISGRSFSCYRTLIWNPFQLTIHKRTTKQKSPSALHRCMRCFVNNHPNQWLKWLPWAEGLTLPIILQSAWVPLKQCMAEIPYKLKLLAKYVNEKLSPHFYGSYAVWEKVGPMAYPLELPPSSQVRPVFHVLQLKRGLTADVPCQ